jgi:hypothetical protein
MNPNNFAAISNSHRLMRLINDHLSLVSYVFREFTGKLLGLTGKLLGLTGKLLGLTGKLLGLTGKLLGLTGKLLGFSA